MTPSEISTAGDITISELTTIFPQLNIFATQTNSTATTINNDASNASISSATALAASNFKGDWSDLTGYLNVPASVYHDNKYWQLLSDLSDVTIKEPGIDSEWIFLTTTYFNVVASYLDLGIGNVIGEKKVTQDTGNTYRWTGSVWIIDASGLNTKEITSAETISATDWGKIIEVTANSFTVTFDAIANLRAGFACYIKNSGDGDITLETNGSETIDGLITFIMYPGETRLFQCNGTVIKSTVINTFYRTWTSTGSFKKPPGYRNFLCQARGGGGGGGSGRRGAEASNRYGGGAGGGGGYNEDFILATDIGATETITIGAGGAGGAAVTVDDTNGNDGTEGGDTTLGSLLKAAGGTNGDKGTANTANGGSGGTVGFIAGFTGGTGGSGSGANSGFGGGAGGAGSVGGATIGYIGGSTTFGSGGGGGGGGRASNNSSTAGGTGGVKYGHTGAGGGAVGTTGTAGSDHGGGGGGGAGEAATAGGAGGDGDVSGGGGGGGGSNNGYNSGAGGAGGSGIAIIQGVI